MGSFDLKPANKFNLFNPTDTRKKEDIIWLSLDDIQPYKGHKIKLYADERLSDMVESVKANGVLSPIIVRPLGENESSYELLAGHNRHNASKLAGLTEIPCIVKYDLSEEDVKFIVDETNLYQRGIHDLRHSERAYVIANHYETMKNQGKRNNLLKEIQKALDIESGEEKAETTRGRSDKSVGQHYGLSKDTVARYIRIDKLIVELKNLIDDKDLPIRAGVNLSYLTLDEQNVLYRYIDDNEVKIDVKKAVALRNLSASGEFMSDEIHKIFIDEKKSVKDSSPKKDIKIERTTIGNYFKKNESNEEVQDTIIKALDFYFKHHDSGEGLNEEQTE